jgi:hypothetical protein
MQMAWRRHSCLFLAMVLIRALLEAALRKLEEASP